MPPKERRARKERLSSALQTIRKFISSFGVVVLQFFEQDTSGGTPPVVPPVKPDKPKEAQQAKPSVVESAEGGMVEEKTATGIAQEPTPKAKSVEQVVPSVEKQQPEATSKQTTGSMAVAKSADPICLQNRKNRHLRKGMIRNQK